MIDKIKEILCQNFGYNMENERIARELFDLYLVSKPFATATETTDNIVKGRKYEIIDDEQMGYYIIDETGEEVYYHNAALNVS